MIRYVCARCVRNEAKGDKRLAIACMMTLVSGRLCTYSLMLCPLCSALREAYAETPRMQQIWTKPQPDQHNAFAAMDGLWLSDPFPILLCFAAYFHCHIVVIQLQQFYNHALCKTGS